MSFDEKRRFKRTPIIFNNDADIEIDHTYGLNRKSYYKVLEYSEYGLSFLVPFDDGYFLVGTPLKFTITQPSIKFRRIFTGAVRYYHPLFMDGKKYYQIGVEVLTTYRDLQNKKMNLRAERIIPSEKSKRIVRIVIDNDSYEFILADFSKYSAAFFCDDDDLIDFSVSSTILINSILVDDLTIFSGIATIIRNYKDNQGRNRIVFQPRNELINIDAINLHIVVKNALTEFNEAKYIYEQNASLEVRYKTAVFDLRCFLENVRRVLDEPQYQTVESEANQLLQLIFPDFFITMDSQITIIDDIVRELSLSNESHLIYKNYFQQNLLDLLLQSPLNHLCYFKPNGYPGDYEMMRLNHLNAFSGPSLFSKILSKYTTSCTFGDAGRKRTEYLKNILFDYLKENQDRPVNIFSIASGPSLEIQELISQHPEVTNNVTFTLLDQEIKALQYSMDSIFDKKIKNNTNITVNFIHNNLQNYLREITQSGVHPTYDIIYSFGLFDYFDKALARFVINSIKPLVKQNGKIIIANASLDNNKYRVLMEYGFDWYLIYRNREELKELAKGNFLYENISIDEIENGIIKFLTLTVKD